MVYCPNCYEEIDENDIHWACPFCGDEGDGFLVCPECDALLTTDGEDWRCEYCDNDYSTKAYSNRA